MRRRRQALTWLRDDLEVWAQQLNRDSDKVRARVGQTLEHWQRDSDLAGVRDRETLLQLPEGERQEWQKLWEHVAALRQRATALSGPGTMGH
jgi:hypothetical protein